METEWKLEKKELTQHWITKEIKNFLTLYLSIVKLPINIYLPFGDVTSKIWSGMCDI